MMKPNYAQAPSNPLLDFKESQKKIAGFFEQTIPLLELLRSNHVEFAHRVRNRLQNETFKVLVIGEFKRGKSTLINALLGEQILPSFSLPCTAVINEIKYGVTKKAILYFKDELANTLPSYLTEEARRHIEQAANGKISPLEVSISELEKYVVIPDPSKDQSESVAETPYQKVEIFWPLDILQNGIEIIDSPGLNEHKTRNDIVINYVDTVDAIIWILTCQALASMSEINEVEKVTKILGHKQVFFVCNFFDQIKATERAHIAKYGRDKLQNFTELESEKSIHFVSALRALEAKTGLDGITEQKLDSVARQERRKESGFDSLEKNLIGFLIQERGKIKLVSPIRQLGNYINTAIMETIPAQTQMAEKSIQDLQKQSEMVNKQLVEQYTRKSQIERQLSMKLDGLESDIQGRFQRQIACCISQIQEWVQKYSPKTDISIFSMKEGAEKLTKEITEHIQREMDEKMLIWSRNQLSEYLTEQLKEIAGKMQKDIEDFLKKIEQIKASAFGIEVEKISQDYKLDACVKTLPRMRHSCKACRFNGRNQAKQRIAPILGAGNWRL